jgi:hypothetical protein
MAEARTWRWEHDGGPHEVTIDLVGGDVLWWSELDPRGDYIDHVKFPQAIESFLRGVRPYCVRGLPAEVEKALSLALTESAGSLAARPPAERLVAAARGGNVPALVALLDSGVSPDAIDVRGRTALWGAIDNAHDEPARVLVERGASVTPPAAAAPHDLLLLALANRLHTAAAALLARGGLLVDETGIAQHWMVGYREHAPLELVKAVAAKAGRMDSPAVLYATRLARERKDAATLAWLDNVNT